MEQLGRLTDILSYSPEPEPIDQQFQDTTAGRNLDLKLDDLKFHESIL